MGLVEPPLLEAPPVRLRPFRHDDVPTILDAATDPAIFGSTTVPPGGDAAAAREFVDRQLSRPAEGLGWSFAVADAATDRAVGQIGLWVHSLRDGRASVGYWVSPADRGRGWTGHALRLISRWGLGLPALHRLELYVEPWNVASWRSAERAGYRREGLLRSWQEVAGERRDMHMYSLLEDDI